MSLRPLPFALCLSILAVAPAAFAQPTPTQAGRSTEASALFERAVASFEKKQFAEALPLFEKSYQLEEALGTLLYLADCHAQLGHTATAWTAFRKAATQATNAKDRRASAANDRVKALEKTLAYLTIAPAPHGPPEQELRLDGRLVPASELGVATPIDPGVHQVDLSAPGRRPVRKAIEVAPGARATVDLPPLVGQASATAAASTATTSGSPAAPPPPVADAPRKGPWRTAGYVAAATGLAVAGIGTYLAVTRTGEANDAAGARQLGSRAAYDDAKSGRTVGLIVAGIGGALATAGVVTVLLHPATTTTLGVGGTPSGAGLQLAGAF